jgi:hypothetical protein
MMKFCFDWSMYASLAFMWKTKRLKLQFDCLCWRIIVVRLFGICGGIFAKCLWFSSSLDVSSFFSYFPLNNDSVTNAKCQDVEIFCVSIAF